ncbi:MAG: hypothetical protein GY839_13010 [candidate division Zixibacteria bacterium]|nr:hypothetical protein [candidate division Zixibacteria bacterium]
MNKNTNARQMAITAFKGIKTAITIAGIPNNVNRIIFWGYNPGLSGNRKFNNREYIKTD